MESNCQACRLINGEDPCTGPHLQAAMFQAKQMPPRTEVEAFCHQARQQFAQDD
jgi:hypothetical protein